jgi:hypothetical protein
MMCSNSFLNVYFRVIPNIHFVSLSYLPIKTHVQKAEKDYDIPKCHIKTKVKP